MAGIITPQEVKKDKERRIADAKAALMNMESFNHLLESYLLEVRSERGYTDREPSDYYNSSVERWSQDARDWISFRDKVMCYGLEVMNQYASTGIAPDIDVFYENLHNIKITWTLS